MLHRRPAGGCTYKRYLYQVSFGEPHTCKCILYHGKSGELYPPMRSAERDFLRAISTCLRAISTLRRSELMKIWGAYLQVNREGGELACRGVQHPGLSQESSLADPGRQQRRHCCRQIAHHLLRLHPQPPPLPLESAVMLLRSSNWFRLWRSKLRNTQSAIK